MMRISHEEQSSVEASTVVKGNVAYHHDQPSGKLISLESCNVTLLLSIATCRVLAIH